jgi:hypothetical protein
MVCDFSRPMLLFKHLLYAAISIIFHIFHTSDNNSPIVVTQVSPRHAAENCLITAPRPPLDPDSVDWIPLVLGLIVTCLFVQIVVLKPKKAPIPLQLRPDADWDDRLGSLSSAQLTLMEMELQTLTAFHARELEDSDDNSTDSEGGFIEVPPAHLILRTCRIAPRQAII